MTNPLYPDLATELRRFAAQDCHQEPLYVALCTLAAGDARLLQLLAEAPPLQRRHVLLLAALHERVLADRRSPLAAYYRSAGGSRAPDPELLGAVHALLDAHAAALLQHLRHGATQTNEVARCAALWPALAATGRLTGQHELALLDFGCSAGLNLGVDAYHFRYRLPGGEVLSRGPAADGQRVEIDAHWFGEPPPAAAPRLISRHGVDPAPVDLRDPARLHWLQACLWPHDARRAERLRRAATQAGAAGWPLQQADDCAAAIEPWLGSLPAGVQPVLFNSWVLTYLPPPALAELRATADRLALSHGLAWLSAELPALSARDAAVPPLPELPAELAHASATLWTLRWPEQGRIREQPLAWSHPHGQWVVWLA